MEGKEVTLSQSNAITESRQNFSRIEKNCLYKIIEKVRSEYIEGASSPKEFENMYIGIGSHLLTDITDKTHKKDAHDALLRLRKRDIEIWGDDGSWLNCGFINWCEYDPTNKLYKIEVSHRIMPYLVELAKNYTTYSLTVAISLKSVYSQRLYELCCRYKNWVEPDGLPGFHMTQQQLREMFCLEDKYKLNADFNRNVILKAQKELKSNYEKKQCDLYFDVNIKGRAGDVKYDFKIHTRETSKQQEEAAVELRKKWLHVNNKMMAIFKRDPKFVQRVMKALDFNPSLIEPLRVKIEKAEMELKGADIAKLLRFILREDFKLK